MIETEEPEAAGESLVLASGPLEEARHGSPQYCRPGAFLLESPREAFPADCEGAWGTLTFEPATPPRDTVILGDGEFFFTTWHGQLAAGVRPPTIGGRSPRLDYEVIGRVHGTEGILRFTPTTKEG